MTNHPAPILTVDVALLTMSKDHVLVGLLTRDQPPFAGERALPGGYVHIDKDSDTEATARRVLKDKTGLTGVLCEQLSTFSGPDRDPRGWSASVVYYAIIPEDAFAAIAETAPLDWVPLKDPGIVAFDHAKVIAAVESRISARAAYSSLPAWFLAPRFTLTDLRRSYEVLIGTPLNDSAFRRKINELDMLEPVEGAKSKSTARPAQLYRLKVPRLTLFDRTI